MVLFKMEVLAVLDILILSLFGLMSAFGNSIVVTSVIKFDYLRTKTNMFIVTLAVVDLSMGVIAFPSTLVLRNIDSNTLSNETFSTWYSACIGTNIFQHAAGMGEMLSIYAITLDRFLFINFPFKYETVMTQKVAIAIVVIIFTVSISFTLFMLLLSDILERGMECSMFNVLAPVFTYSIWMPFTGVGTILICAFYGKIAFIALSKKNVAPQHATDGTSQGQSQSKSQTKVTKVMALVIGIFVCTYGEWFTIFFVTTGIDGFTVDVIQYAATWFWAVSLCLKI